MGWKGAIRSFSAASNKHSKSMNRRARAQQKDLDILRKKLEKIQESREKVLMALKNRFADNSITREEYEKLQGRMTEVTDEILIFGKTPAVTLCKNYVCGEIDKATFDEVRAALVPVALDAERNSIMTAVAEKQKQQADFLSGCSAKEGSCGKCGKEKKWYSIFGQINNISTCGKCISKYKSYCKYSGFNGDYLTVEPCEVTQDTKLNVSLKQTWI